MVLAIGFNILNQIQSKILFVIAMIRPNKARKTLISIRVIVCVLCELYMYVRYEERGETVYCSRRKHKTINKHFSPPKWNHIDFTNLY
jgi:hypothetical protein